MNWEAITAICAVVALLLGGQLAYLRLMVDRSVSKAFDAHAEKMNGKYQMREMCEQKHGACRAEVERRLERLEET